MQCRNQGWWGGGPNLCFAIPTLFICYHRGSRNRTFPRSAQSLVAGFDFDTDFSRNNPISNERDAVKRHLVTHMIPTSGTSNMVFLSFDCMGDFGFGYWGYTSQESMLLPTVWPSWMKYLGIEIPYALSLVADSQPGVSLIAIATTIIYGRSL